MNLAKLYPLTVLRWLEEGRLGVAAFEHIKSKYEWIINQTKCTQWHDMIVKPKDQCNDYIENYADFQLMTFI